MINPPSSERTSETAHSLFSFHEIQLHSLSTAPITNQPLHYHPVDCRREWSWNSNNIVLSLTSLPVTMHRLRCSYFQKVPFFQSSFPWLNLQNFTRYFIQLTGNYYHFDSGEQTPADGCRPTLLKTRPPWHNTSLQIIVMMITHNSTRIDWRSFPRPTDNVDRFSFRIK